MSGPFPEGSTEQREHALRTQLTAARQALRQCVEALQHVCDAHRPRRWTMLEAALAAAARAQLGEEG